MTVPALAIVSELWLGISSGTISAGGVGMQPILAHIRQAIPPGRHEFRLTWTVPAKLRHDASLC